MESVHVHSVHATSSNQLTLTHFHSMENIITFENTPPAPPHLVPAHLPHLPRFSDFLLLRHPATCSATPAQHTCDTNRKNLAPGNNNPKYMLRKWDKTAAAYFLSGARLHRSVGIHTHLTLQLTLTARTRTRRMIQAPYRSPEALLAVQAAAPMLGRMRAHSPASLQAHDISTEVMRCVMDALVGRGGTAVTCTPERFW